MGFKLRFSGLVFNFVALEMDDIVTLEALEPDMNENETVTDYRQSISLLDHSVSLFCKALNSLTHQGGSRTGYL